MGQADASPREKTAPPPPVFIETIPSRTDTLTAQLDAQSQAMASALHLLLPFAVLVLVLAKGLRWMNGESEPTSRAPVRCDPSLPMAPVDSSSLPLRSKPGIDLTKH